MRGTLRQRRHKELVKDSQFDKQLNRLCDKRGVLDKRDSNIHFVACKARLIVSLTKHKDIKLI